MSLWWEAGIVTVVHAFKTSIWEAEAGKSRWVPSHPSLHSKLQANQGYIVRPYLKQ